MEGLKNLYQESVALKLKIVFSLVFGTFYINSFAQSELPKFASDVEKIKVKLDMPLEGRLYKNGTGYSLNPKMISKLPKRVALVSFYTFDPGFTKVWKYSTTKYEYKFSDNDYNYYSKKKYTTTNITRRNSKGNLGSISTGFYAHAIGVLKSQFKKMGMDLLEPEQFLDTDDKKEFYQRFRVKRSKLNEFIEKVNSGASHASLYAYPEGYKVLAVENEPFGNYYKKGALSSTTYKRNVTDGQLWVHSKIGKEITSINELTRALGVDAVLLVYSTIYTPKETQVDLQNVNMLMFGPNPVALPEGKDKKFNYFPSQMYIGTRVNVGVPILNEKKKDPESSKLNFEGYGKIIEAMTIRMKAYFDKAMRN